MARYALVITDPGRAVAHDRVGAAAGDLWAIAERECPLGQPNCPDCGDPAHRDACHAAGHCPQCGTAHGIAPTARLAAIGVILVELDATGAPVDRAWTRTPAGRWVRG